MLPIFENTNFTAVDDFLRLTIPNIHNSDRKIFSDIKKTEKFVKYTFYSSPPKMSLERLKLETSNSVCMLIVASTSLQMTNCL